MDTDKDWWVDSKTSRNPKWIMKPNLKPIEITEVWNRSMVSA